MEKIRNQYYWDGKDGTLLIYELCGACECLISEKDGTHVLHGEQYFHGACFEYALKRE